MRVTLEVAEDAEAARRPPSRWPGRLAAWALVAAVPLVLFGGMVTTMRAGMAEDGWLQPDGHLLWLYPWALRIRNAGVFVEHHHRELGSLVGVLSIATVVAAFARDPRWSARLLAVAGLFAVSIQGAVGGFRVLENSPGLAFLHGALGQAVFALLAIVAVVLSPRWRDARPGGWATPPRIAPFAWLALLVVFGQAVAGAWLRHGHAPEALMTHVVGAFLATGAVVVTALRLKTAALAPDAGEAGRALRRHGLRLHVLLGIQILLGLLATVAVYQFSGGMKSDQIAHSELVFATAHVAVGALLLAALASAALWSGRLASRAAARPAADPRLAAEGGAA